MKDQIDIPIAETIIKDFRSKFSELYAAEDYENLYILLKDWTDKNPQDIGAYNNLAVTLGHLERYDESLKLFNHLLEKAPTYIQARKDRGILLSRMREPLKAIADFKEYLKVKPKDSDLWNHYGNTLIQLGKYNRAIRAMQQGIDINPNNNKLKFNLSMNQLLIGQYKVGFSNYEFRWDGELTKSPAFPVFSQLQAAGIKRLTPDFDFKDKRILITNEQGLGDTLQFLRFVPAIKAKGAKLIFGFYGGNNPLMGYFKTIKEFEEVHSDLTTMVNVKGYCGIGSLAYLAGVEKDQDIPPPLPPIIPNTTIKHWNEWLGKKRKFRVAISNSGNLDNPINPNRSVAFKEFSSLLELDAEFVLLQPNLSQEDSEAIKAYPQIRNPTPLLKDFLDTASILNQCDLVICVDTSLLHLAGSLNIPVWGLIRKNADWRWLLNRVDSPWYSSLTIYRQNEYKNWLPVIEAVKTALQKRIEAKESF